MSEQILFTTVLDPRAQPLLEALTQEYDTRYGDIFRDPSLPPEMQRYPAQAFAAPHGNFVLLLREGKTLAGGAFKRYDEHTAEFKRIWTHSDARRQGLARKVLVALEAQALAQGYRRIYLTTGFRQPEAVGLYLDHGYTRLYDPNHTPGELLTFPFEKHLHYTPARAHPRPSATATHFPQTQTV